MSEEVQTEIDKYIKTQTALFDAVAKSSDQVVSPGQIDYTAPLAAQTISVLNTNRLAQEEFLKINDLECSQYYYQEFLKSKQEIETLNQQRIGQNPG
jgi:uncharacterized lipoprotein YddW (UPF0748 family)